MALTSNVRTSAARESEPRADEPAPLDGESAAAGAVAVSAPEPSGRVAIVHDYVTQRGGAERVVLAMLAAFPGAPLYTSVYEPSTSFPGFKDHDVRTLWTDRLDALHRDHRRGLPLYPIAFSKSTVDAEVVLCSSSGFAHGIGADGRKVVYCHTPARWLYEEAPGYLAGCRAPIAAAVRACGGALRVWDRHAARSAHRVLANSTAVRDRIANAYDIDAEVLPPPVTVAADGEQRPVARVEPGYVLSVGRLLSYKHTDTVVAAMDLLPRHRLVVAGTGPELARLTTIAGANVTFVGAVDDAELRWLYANCAGVVSASYEDYGLTPLEAAAHGKPVAVLRYGGFVDTVVDGRTGHFFDTPTPWAIAGAITAMTEARWCTDEIVTHAQRYSCEAFSRRLVEIVTEQSPSRAPAPAPAGAPSPGRVLTSVTAKRA